MVYCVALCTAVAASIPITFCENVTFFVAKKYFFVQAEADFAAAAAAALHGLQIVFVDARAADADAAGRSQTPDPNGGIRGGPDHVSACREPEMAVLPRIATGRVICNIPPCKVPAL